MINSKQIVYGLNMQMTDETVVETAALAGFDFIRLDACHYPYTLDHMVRIIRTADSVGLPVIARIDSLEQAAMMLDFGLAGVMFQQVQKHSMSFMVQVLQLPIYSQMKKSATMICLQLCSFHLHAKQQTS